MAPEVSYLVRHWKELDPVDRANRMGEIVGDGAVNIGVSAAGAGVAKNLAMLSRAKVVTKLDKLKYAGAVAKLEKSVPQKWLNKTKPAVQALKKEMHGQPQAKLCRRLRKEFAGHSLTESQVRIILHEAGVQTYARPKGIPANCEVKICKKSGGMEYIKPGTTDKQNITVRVMPGNPMSGNSAQKKPYVVQRRGDKALSEKGEFICAKVKEAHIPLEEYQFEGW